MADKSFKKTCESFHDTHEIFFRKPLSKENFPVCHDLKTPLQTQAAHGLSMNIHEHHTDTVAW